MSDEPRIRPENEENPKTAASAPSPGGGALLESPEAAVERLARELSDLNERHLRLAAEYDNFRKRTTRERTELWGSAQADLVARLVDALDDLARFAHVDPAAINAKTLRDGVEMVERKLWKELEAARVERVDKVGVPFDPAVHEAVTTSPTTDPARDHTVGAVLQPGYRLGERLLRPARVQVLVVQGDPS
ncbi:MAG TPA: nucleotide exchange factor GrpE [Gemmatimonadales bacterium]|nr:nucleotide exchange factor GrpE [Gemmatimonadales bacterium]